MEIKKYNRIEILLSLMLVTIFISKSLFNALSGIILLIAVYKLVKKNKINKNLIMVSYALIPFVGLLINGLIFGIEEMKNYLDVERGMLFPFVFLVLNLSLKEYERIKNWVLIGGISSAVYSGISFFTPKFLGITTYYAEYKRTNKMASFQNPIRWARLLQIMVPFSYINLEWVRKRVYKIFFILLSMYFIWNIVINGQRAAILGAFASMTIFFFMYIFSLKKNRLLHISLIGIISLILSYGIIHGDKMIEKRIVSIFDLNENISNRVRVDFWKTGTDILRENNYKGVGSGNSRKAFEKFISKRSEKYINKYYKYQEGEPFENNYLNIVIENGLVYLIYFLSVQVIILIEIFRAYLKEPCKDKKIKLMIIFSLIIGDRIFMFFYPGTDTYIEFLITFLIFYAFKLKEAEKIDG